MTRSELYYIKLGRELATLRRKKKLKQADLADLLRISRQTVTRFESGKLKIDIYFLNQIYKILNQTNV